MHAKAAIPDFGMPLVATLDALRPFATAKIVVEDALIQVIRGIGLVATKKTFSISIAAFNEV